MGSMVNSVTVSQLGSVSSPFRWGSLSGIGIRGYRKFMVMEFRDNSRRDSSAGEKGKFGFLRKFGKRMVACCSYEENKVENKLETLWDDDEYGIQTVMKDYVEIAKETMVRPDDDDDGPPRRICPIECDALLMGMESSGELVAFPLLATPIVTNYRACTIPYRFPSDDLKKPTPTELSYINLVSNSIPCFQKRAESDDSVPDAPARAEKFAQRYSEILEDLKKDPQSHGGPPDCILLCQLREQVLRELGFRDIFKKVKDEENAKAISLFEEVVHLNDAIEDSSKRMENLVRGIFSGNIFDLGSADLEELFSKDGMSFMASTQNLLPRPWVIDDLEAFASKWSKNAWKKAVIFVDNSGADVILGILPFCRELLRRGTRVVLAANELPSVNDVTYPELIEIVSKLKDDKGTLAGVDATNLFIANSGNDLPVIDLTRTSQELAFVANDADLVVLEGMGRGIETNLYAQFKCDLSKLEW